MRRVRDSERDRAVAARAIGRRPGRERARPATAVLAVALAGLASCVDVVDLRTPRDPPPACGPGLRLDPATGACAPCVVDEPPPPPTCPCGVERAPGPFPACEGDSRVVGCVPCTGGITACLGYDVVAGTTTDCASLGACCIQLALDPASDPCCPAGANLICAATGNLGQYRVTCDPGCCRGAPCVRDEQCASWQTCDLQLGECVPACQAGMTECGIDCTCKQLPQPG